VATSLRTCVYHIQDPTDWNGDRRRIHSSGADRREIVVSYIYRLLLFSSLLLHGRLLAESHQRERRVNVVRFLDGREKSKPRGMFHFILFGMHRKVYLFELCQKVYVILLFRFSLRSRTSGRERRSSIC